MAHSDAPLIAIVGPTAVGKTALSLILAEALAGEIVSADSRLVYTGMDIGTAKPSAAEIRRAPHHLIDILRPDETLTLAGYQRMAYQTIDAIHARGTLPILVGGTGLYAAAVLEGWGIPEVAPAPAIRAELESFAEIYGEVALFERLRQVDTESASTVEYRNARRVMRALEIHRVMGRPASELQRREPPPYRILRVGLTMPRELLYRRIDARIDAMIARGLIAEISGLINAGYGWELPSMSALGYQEFRQYLSGDISLEDAIALVKHNTRAFVRKQYNWFRLTDASIYWHDGLALESESIINQLRTWLDGGVYG